MYAYFVGLFVSYYVVVHVETKQFDVFEGLKFSGRVNPVKNKYMVAL
jgi:hypothetical protein